MTTPFITTGHPIFLTYGQSNDTYCLTNGVEVGYEQMLHAHLQRQGFERIVFFGHRGCYMFDQQSVNLFRKKKKGIHPPDQRHSPPSGLKAGPGGFARRRKKQASVSPVAGNCEYRYPDLSQVQHMVPLLERLMTEREFKTAVILADVNIFSLARHTPFTEKMRALLQHVIPGLPTANQNIFVVNVPSSDPGEALRNKKWDFLFFNRETKQPGLASLVCLGPPEQDEVKNYLLSTWLKQDILVDWKSFSQCCTTLTAHIKSRTELASIRLLAPFLNNKMAITPENIRNITGESLRLSAQEQLDTLIGLKKVKAYLKRKTNGIDNIRKKNKTVSSPVQTEEIQRLCALPVPAWRQKLELHLALTGNAGTGKTSIARLIGELYRDAGVLELGHLVKVTRKDLAAEYMGQSAPKTGAAIQRSLGGVLFIDEAYDVCRGDDDKFGLEVVATLVEAMTALKGQFMVIIAGYPNDIKKFIATNPGFPRRFSQTLHIDDYQPEELELLLRKFLNDLQAPPLSMELDQGLGRLCRNFYGERTKTSGNAGAMEQFAAALVEEHGHKDVITPQDLPEKMQLYFKKEEIMDQGMLTDLDKMVGLDSVKEAVTTMFNMRRAEQIRQQNPDARVMPGHFLFVGNPGTGKTEVARLMARQFHALGLVGNRKLHAMSAPEFTQGYVGQTKERAVEFLNQGIGRVIFIDEAHQLYKSDVQNDYGQDVIEAMIPFVDAHRNDCIIILAGYEDAIHEMITRGDQGALSRFPNIIRFENFTSTELVAIFDLMLTDRGLQWPRELSDYLEQYFSIIRVNHGSSFGNARFVRNMVDACIARQANRLVDESDESLFWKLTAEDFPEIP